MMLNTNKIELNRYYGSDVIPLQIVRIDLKWLHVCVRMRTCAINTASIFTFYDQILDAPHNYIKG